MLSYRICAKRISSSIFPSDCPRTISSKSSISGGWAGGHRGPSLQTTTAVSRSLGESERQMARNETKTRRLKRLDRKARVAATLTEPAHQKQCMEARDPLGQAGDDQGPPTASRKYFQTRSVPPSNFEWPTRTRNRKRGACGALGLNKSRL